ncbi:type II toxin-antitoxin system CcdA family antitoxin [Roseomonas sp. AR75]|uniref:type II toxin-antitoxin system CcdA family antitoxin n=1 Tax=Roseomonas sp. AR75 TaxID=2562311 RepID=UPI00197F3296|nr:type II toxin-antitoxin system CcdA family antitoxin [Roseomonas sp. AR75]
MTLRDYLRRTGTTLTAFGDRVGVSHTTVMRWAAGQAAPRDKATMEAVARATDGAVTAADFFTPAGPAPSQGLAESQAPFAEARALGLDPDAVAVRAIQDAIRAEKARRWQEENREALEAQNAWIEKHGLPLAKYRIF